MFSAKLFSTGDFHFLPLTSIIFQEKPLVLELPSNMQRSAYKLAVCDLGLRQNVQNVFIWTVAINILSLSREQEPGN